MKHLKKFGSLFEAKLTEDDTVEFIKDVECEIFRSEKQEKGKIELVQKGEEADVFSIPDKGDFIGVQFGDGSITWVNKKLLKKI